MLNKHLAKWLNKIPIFSILELLLIGNFTFFAKLFEFYIFYQLVKNIEDVVSGTIIISGIKKNIIENPDFVIYDNYPTKIFFKYFSNNPKNVKVIIYFGKNVNSLTPEVIL